MKATQTDGFRCETEGKTLSLYIYGDVAAADVSARGIADAIDGAKGVTTTKVYINSPGGSVFEGFAIYNLLRRAEANVIVYVDGIAGSIASLIALAGNEIHMAANAYVMIHNPSGLVLGNASDMRYLADKLERIGETIADSYAARTGNTREQLVAWMDEETWFDAEEAKEHGFANTITEDEGAENTFDLSVFNNTPAALLPQAKERKQPRRDYSRQAVETIVAGFPDFFGSLTSERCSGIRSRRDTTESKGASHGGNNRFD